MILLIAYGERALPQGVFDLRSFLRSHGHKAEVVHLYGDIGSLQAVTHEPTHIGISVYTQVSGQLRPLIAAVRAKWPKAKVILGGWHITADTLEVETDLPELVDHLVIGEGEYALADILDGRPDRIVYGGLLSAEDYAALPLPTREEIEEFFRAYPERVRFARGCPNSCTFCTANRKRVIRIDPEKAARYAADVRQWVGGTVYVLDDIFTTDRDWLNAYADASDTPIRCFVHGRDFDTALAETLSRANVVHATLGAESGDDGVLKLIAKRATVDDYWLVHRVLKYFPSIQLHCLWMLGLPGETEATLAKTLDLAGRIGNRQPNFGFALPYPGSVFWKYRERWGKIIQPDWSKWETCRPAFIPHGLTEEYLMRMRTKAREIRI